MCVYNSLAHLLACFLSYRMRVSNGLIFKRYKINTQSTIESDGFNKRYNVYHLPDLLGSRSHVRGRVNNTGSRGTNLQP